MQRKFCAITLLVVVLFCGLILSASAHPGAQTNNTGLIASLMSAFEQRDLDRITPYLCEDVSLVQPLTLSGSPTPEGSFEGRRAVTGYFQQVFRAMGRIHFANVRLSGADDGKSVYYEATGDFTTAAGAPYRNVYIFRFDLRGGKVAHISEYANPITFSQTFGATPASR